MVYTEEAFKAELNAKGWRATRQREIILQTFQNLPEGTHLSAEELHKKLREEGHNISLSTIYRTVKLMARMGILRELELTEGHKHYEINQPAPHHHHHLVCVKTNKVIEFKNNAILNISQKVAEKYGFKVLDCQLTIWTVGGIPPARRRFRSQPHLSFPVGLLLADGAAVESQALDLGIAAGNCLLEPGRQPLMVESNVSRVVDHDHQSVIPRTALEGLGLHLNSQTQVCQSLL
jgi:Fur family ferric uptake transcriptional regulator